LIEKIVLNGNVVWPNPLMAEQSLMLHYQEPYASDAKYTNCPKLSLMHAAAKVRFPPNVSFAYVCFGLGAAI
jgi:hypothetical protein